MAPGEKEYGLARLKSILKKSVGRTAREVVRAVFDELAQFTAGERQMDDRTLVVVRRL
jgi:serine phosphatase RsbU (regulator of sigma subunit)